MFEWTFERDGKSRQVSVDGRVIVNDTDLAVRTAVDGLGIAYAAEAVSDPFLRSGQLIRVLEDWSPSFEGFFLYYPGHRQVRVALRALIDMLHAAPGPALAKGLLEHSLPQTKPRRKAPQPYVPGCERLPMRRPFMKVSHRQIKFSAIE